MSRTARNMHVQDDYITNNLGTIFFSDIARTDFRYCLSDQDLHLVLITGLQYTPFGFVIVKFVWERTHGSANGALEGARSKCWRFEVVSGAKL